MNNKKIIISFLLVVLIAVTLGSVSAEDVTGDVIAVDESADVLSVDSVQPAENTVTAVQDAINSINETGTVDLSNFPSYDFADSGVTIAKSNIILKGDGNTIIQGYGKSNGLVYITGSNVTIQGINFIDTDPTNNFVYGGTVAGFGVNMRNVNNVEVSDCTFTDFNAGVVVQAAEYVTIKNNNFSGGYTTVIANDPTVNVEKGTKAINIYRGSSKVTVKGNTFEGQILDGVSIAQGSGSNIVEENTFINNTYSIYFGGSSTKNSVIRNNKFINCGYFKEGDIVWTELPVISIQKASNDIAIENNNFTALNNSVLIAAEQGNEAHGFPSSLGNINVTGNTVTLADETVNPKSIILFNILCRNGDLNLSAPIDVTGNTVPDGVNVVSLQTTGDTTFEETVTPIATNITVGNLAIKAGNVGNLKITLKDQNGNPLANKTISVLIDGKVFSSGTTDENGLLSVPVKYASATTKFVYVSFIDAEGKYVSSFNSAKITVIKKATALAAVNTVFKVNVAKKVNVILKSEGKALAGKKVTITVNKKTFTAKTNAKGIAIVNVKIAKKGKFYAIVKFAGDGAYKPIAKKVLYTVK